MSTSNVQATKLVGMLQVSIFTNYEGMISQTEISAKMVFFK